MCSYPGLPFSRFATLANYSSRPRRRLSVELACIASAEHMATLSQLVQVLPSCFQLARTFFVAVYGCFRADDAPQYLFGFRKR